MNKGQGWKRKTAVVAGCFLFMIILLNGCGKKEETGAEESQETEETSGEQETESEEDVIQEPEQIPEELGAEVSETAVQEIRNTDNVIFLRSSVQDIRVTIPDYPEAEEKIGQFFADRSAACEDTLEEYRKAAVEDWKAWNEKAEEEAESETEEETENGWTGYELSREYTVKRCDGQMISIVEECFVDTGSSRLYTVRVAYNFDTQTGERMSLEDVASDLDEICSESARRLGEIFQEPEWEEVLHSDYKNHLEDILTDSTWYTDEEGFHIICNEDVIMRRSKGIQEFTLPYDEVDVVAGKYKPELTDDRPVSPPDNED